MSSVSVVVVVVVVVMVVVVVVGVLVMYMGRAVVYLNVCGRSGCSSSVYLCGCGFSSAFHLL